MKFRLLIVLFLFPFIGFSQTYLFGIVYGGSTTPQPSGDTSVIVCDGNSLTYGYDLISDSSYPTKLSQRSPYNSNGSSVSNYGVSGQSTIDMLNDYSSQIAPLYNANQNSILIAWELTNDLYNTGNTDTVINRIVRYCEGGQATGFKVIVMTGIARKITGTTTGGDNQSSFNSKMSTINTYLKTNFASFADEIVALDETFTDFNDTGKYLADGVHLSGPGYTVVVNLIMEQIVNL